MVANRWDQLIDQWDATLRRAFLDAVARLRDGVQIEQVIRLLEKNRDIEGAMRAVGLDPVSFRVFERGIEQAFESGGNYTANQIPAVRDPGGFRLIAQFNIRNPSAEGWLRTHSSRLIAEIMSDQRILVRGHLEAGMREGLNPRTTALDLAGRIGPTGRREGGVIGLTSSQGEWVRNYARELASETPIDALSRALRDRRFDQTVRRYAEEGRAIPAALRDKMITAYRNRALRYRAETIARSEAMAALHQAQEEAMRQGIEKGAIQASALTYIWRATRDKRTRDSHVAMQGQVARAGDPFVTGTGARLRYPGDPLGPAHEVINCRCWREPRVDFLAGVR